MIKPWHFNGRNEKEQASYNVLNDVSLVANILLKFILFICVPTYCLLALLSTVDIALMKISDANFFVLFIWNLIKIVLCVLFVFRLVERVVKIYWIPLLNAHRRIHARYWRAMYRAVKK